MMKTYSKLRKPVTFMCFWLNYCNENHYIKRITVAVKDIYHPYHLFNLASQLRLIGLICFCFLTALELVIMNI